MRQEVSITNVSAINSHDKPRRNSAKEKKDISVNVYLFLNKNDVLGFGHFHMPCLWALLLGIGSQFHKYGREGVPVNLR